MSVKYERAVAEDLNLGYGSVSVSMPGGGSATGSKVGIHTFMGDRYRNVKDAGAIGDGRVNDTAAIQALIDDLIALGGGVLYFPEGTYNIYSALTTAGDGATTGPNISFIGEGPNRSIIQNLGTGHALDLSQTWDSPAEPVGEIFWFPRIQGLRILGTSASSVGVNISEVRTLVIEDCWIIGHGAEGIKTSDAYLLTLRDVHIRACGAASTAHGVKLTNATHWTKVYGCSSCNNSGSGFAIASPGASNGVAFFGVNAEGNTRYGLEISNSSGTLISGGYLENNTLGDIRLWNGAQACSIHGVYMNVTTEPGITIETFQGVDIRGNVCSSSHSSFVRLTANAAHDVHVGKNFSSATNYVDGTTAGAFPSACLGLVVERCVDSGQDFRIEDGGAANIRIWRQGDTTTGVFDLVGDRIYHTTPTAGGSIGWVCVTAGAPGTWKTFGAISS